MDQITISRIFEPFYTKKFSGRGPGMAAVYGIVKNHDGWISVDSELDKGTVVRIYLPAIEVLPKEIEEPRNRLPEGTYTILMIEDEDSVTDVTTAMLEGQGHRVLAAKTGKKAIKTAKTIDFEIDLAIQDVVLPDMDGKAIYRALGDARSSLKVIVCSGYTQDGPVQGILDEGAQGFIQKPFSRG